MLASLMRKTGLKLSLNDPRWGRGSQDDNDPSKNNGKKPGDGPPDLDQLWQDFNQWLSRLFGGDNKGGVECCRSNGSLCLLNV